MYPIIYTTVTPQTRNPHSLNHIPYFLFLLTKLQTAEVRQNVRDKRLSVSKLLFRNVIFFFRYPYRSIGQLEIPYARE